MAFADLIAGADRVVQALLDGESIVYQPSLGPPVTVTGVFDENYVLDRDERGDPVAQSVRPAVFVRLSDLPEDDPPNPLDFNNPAAAPTPVPLVTIRDVDYRVVWRRTDSMGGVVLVLARTA